MGFRLRVLGLVASLLFAACSSPDTEAEFEDFAAATLDMRAGEAGPLPDASEATLQSGRYFMTVNTVVMPGALIYLEATATVAEGGGTADFVLQPLKTDEEANGDPRADARVPVGDPVTVSGVTITDGAFTMLVGDVMIDGEANPITTGADIVANLTLIGVVADETTICGTANGDVTEPIELNIDNSTFAAVQTDGDFTAITTPVFRCAEEPVGDPSPDAGVD